MPEDQPTPKPKPPKPDAPEGEPPVWDLSDAADINVAQLIERVGQLESELEASKGRAVRVMADLQNIQRRAHQNEVVARRQGESAVAMSVVAVLDHFDMALKSTTPTAGAEQVIAGMQIIYDELLKALGRHGVVQVLPQKNDEFVPGTHEALMQQVGEGVEPGRIVGVVQAGYAIGQGADARVIRPAKVIVAPSE